MVVWRAQAASNKKACRLAGFFVGVTQPGGISGSTRASSWANDSCQPR